MFDWRASLSRVSSRSIDGPDGWLKIRSGFFSQTRPCRIACDQGWAAHAPAECSLLLGGVALGR